MGSWKLRVSNLIVLIESEIKHETFNNAILAIYRGIGNEKSNQSNYNICKSILLNDLLINDNSLKYWILQDFKIKSYDNFKRSSQKADTFSRLLSVNAKQCTCYCLKNPKSVGEILVGLRWKKDKETLDVTIQEASCLRIMDQDKRTSSK